MCGCGTRTTPKMYGTRLACICEDSQDLDRSSARLSAVAPRVRLHASALSSFHASHSPSDLHSNAHISAVLRPYNIGLTSAEAPLHTRPSRHLQGTSLQPPPGWDLIQTARAPRFGVATKPCTQGKLRVPSHHQTARYQARSHVDEAAGIRLTSLAYVHTHACTCVLKRTRLRRQGGSCHPLAGPM